MNGNLICRVVLSRYFHCSYTDITTNFKLFCIGIAQVGNSTTESNLWGPGGWQIAESHWSDEGQQHTDLCEQECRQQFKEVTIPHHSTTVRLHLKQYILSWAPQHKWGSLGEGCYYQLAGGLGCTSHRERLMELNFLSLQRQKGYYYCYCQLFNGDNREDATRLLSEQ